MITAEDTYDVAGQVLEIPLTLIEPAVDNVRSDLGDPADLQALADSILEVGVLEPIIVYANAGGDDFTILAGARRHAASELAGALTIPAIVRPKPDDKSRVIAMLIENVQRSDLTPIDEARAYARLEELGLTQVEIKDRVRCSQSHVSKRLMLLELPEVARAMVIAKTLAIADAVELAKLATDPDRVIEILDGWADLDADERHWRITEAVEEVERAERLVTLTGEWNAKGIPVLDDAQAGRAHQLVATGDYAYRKHVVLAKADVKKHAKEPCHAVALVWRFDKFETVEYCTSADRHGPKGASKIKAAEPVSAKAGSGKSAGQVEREQREKEIAKHRTEFVTAVVRDRKFDRARVTANALTSVALGGYGSDHEKRARLLGLDLTGRNPTQALTDYVAGGTDHMIRACLATMLKNATSPHADDDTLALLNDLGYEPSPLELEHREARAADEAERVANRDAWEAFDRAEGRAQELAADNPRLADIQAEIDEGVSAARAVELQGELDAMFIELNDIQPGDVVDHDGTGHTIERAAATVDDDQGDELEYEPTDDDKVLCAFPGCNLDDEHEGGHHVVLADYAKPPKDCSSAEAMARTMIVSVVDAHPDDDEVLGIQQELLAGVDDERAIEIKARLRELYPLTDYETTKPAPLEGQCRDMIKALPADHPRVAELQQQLYRGVNTGAASAIRRELKQLKAELQAATP